MISDTQHTSIVSYRLVFMEKLRNFMDTRRLVRKIGFLDKDIFERIRKIVRDMP